MIFFNKKSLRSVTIVVGIVLFLDILSAQLLKLAPNSIFSNTDQYWHVGEPLNRKLGDANVTLAVGLMV